MTDDSSKNAKWAEQRHRLFPRRVCLAHLVLPNEPLCTGERGKGTKLCIEHQRRIARGIGWKSDEQRRQERTARDASRDTEIATKRARIDDLTRENNELRAEIRRLTDMTPAERRAEQRPTDGTVYVLLSGYNVKVGWTGRDLAERLREYPPSTTLLVHFPGKRGDETRIKRRFAHLRTHGNEWLPYAPQVTEWVEQMVTEHGPPNPDIVCGPAKYRVPRPHTQKPAPRPRHTAWHVS